MLRQDAAVDSRGIAPFHLVEVLLDKETLELTVVVKTESLRGAAVAQAVGAAFIAAIQSVLPASR